MILVIGKSGQIAKALQELKPKEVVSLSRAECDLAKPESLGAALTAHLKTGKYNCLINAGAFTQVDLAEKERDGCHRMNALSPPLIAKICSDHRIQFIHYSTDYVYGASGNSSITETSPCAPLNYYGKTKLAGDIGILETKTPALILRTAWVYDHRGKNFVEPNSSTQSLQTSKTGNYLDAIARTGCNENYRGNGGQNRKPHSPMSH